MVPRTYRAPTVAFLLVAARLVAASCTTDDPDGSRVLAARAQVQSDCPCDQSDAPLYNHGQYVSCAVAIANLRAGLDPSNPDFLPKSCKGAVKRCAGRTVCGKPNFVTCCITNARGVMRCRTKKATVCTSHNGVAGACTSCCDACPSPGNGPSCPTTTTTTLPCGESNAPCCANGGCNAPNVCCNGYCTPPSSCPVTTTTTNSTTTTTMTTSCGDSNQPCCTTGDACRVPNVCVSGTCLYCGMVGGPCCPPAAFSRCFTPSDVCCNGTCLPPAYCPPTTTTTLP